MDSCVGRSPVDVLRVTKEGLVKQRIQQFDRGPSTDTSPPLPEEPNLRRRQTVGEVEFRKKITHSLSLPKRHSITHRPVSYYDTTRPSRISKIGKLLFGEYNLSCYNIMSNMLALIMQYFPALVESVKSVTQSFSPTAQNTLRSVQTFTSICVPFPIAITVFHILGVIKLYCLRIIQDVLNFILILMHIRCTYCQVRLKH